MSAVVFIIGVILGVTAAETTTLDILKRLDATEARVRTLLSEVEDLKSQDKRQRTQIADMKMQIRYQQQRSSYLERLVRKLMTHKRQENSVKTEKGHILKPEPTIEKGKIISRIRRADNETPVAFFAKMDAHLEHAGLHQIFVFETVVTNVGNAYNNHVGTFIAPVSGTYVFSTTLVSSYHVSANAQFMKNGNAVTTLYVSGEEAGNDTTSQTIVLQLQKGDDVCIQNLVSDKSFYGASHSTFSGFLLQEDMSSPAIVGK